MIEEYEEEMLRKNLLDFGYKIPTLEMPRAFYLENRISKEERKKLVDILKILKGITRDKHSSILAKHRNAYHSYFGLLAIGTAVWPDEDFVQLEKFFAKKGFSREDEFEEHAAAAMWNQQCRDHETYEDYVKWCNEPEAFDEKLTPMSRERFEEEKKKEEIPYIKTKKIGDFLDNKGEDLDFIIFNERSGGDRKYDQSVITDLRLVFLEGLKEKGYNVRDELDYLDSGDYFISPEGKLIRYKLIIAPEHDGSCRVSFPDSRSFHFYFESENLDIRIKKERIENFPFCQLVRRENIGDLEATIHNGEENGFFENPDYSRFEKV